MQSINAITKQSRTIFRRLIASCTLCLIPAAIANPGAQLYLHGQAQPMPQVYLQGGDTPLPMSLFPCANCHGLEGKGKKEAGVNAPAISWQQLSRPYTVTLSNQRQRPAYDLNLLHRLLTQGLDSSGQAIKGMPRYALSKAQSRQLQSYLTTLGSGVTQRVAEGIQRNAIHIGLLRSEQATDNSALWADMQQTLRAWRQQINQHGGLFRRKIVVHFGNVAQLNQLHRQPGLFAVLTLYAEDAQHLSDHALPIISAIADDTQKGEWHWSVFGLVDQSDILMLRRTHYQNQLSLERFLQTQADKTADLLLALHPKYPLSQPILERLAQWSGTVLVPNWPNQSKLNRYGQQRYAKLQAHHPLPEQHITEQLWLLSCAEILAEGIKASGRRLSRARWREQIEKLNAFNTLWLGHVSFVPPQKIGQPVVSWKRLQFD